LLAIRRALGLFANLRPALLYPELAASSSLKPEVVSGLDIMIVRELTGDIYFGAPRGRRVNAAGDAEGFDTMLYSEPEISASQPSASGRARASEALCSVDNNVLDT
jgi:3-isopropylmalate dehydrogenase